MEQAPQGSDQSTEVLEFKGVWTLVSDIRLDFWVVRRWTL